MNEFLFFGAFLLLIILMIALDFGLLTKNSHVVSIREASIMTSIWVSLSIGFFFFVRFHGDMIHGIDTIERLQEIIKLHHHPINISGMDFDTAIQLYRSNLSLEYITGYLIEYALSVDNMFVILLIFMSFKVRQKYYKKVLLWGIAGAIVLRFMFIFFSSALIHRFEWILYVFGAFLLFTGVKMFITKGKESTTEVAHHPVVRFTSRLFRVFPRFVKDRFFVVKNNKIFLTPLFVVVLVIEFSDIIFAVDSVPAIFSITKDPYIVFFSNIFAIMGLRSLFFLLSGFMDRFRFLKPGLAVLLAVIGLKLIFEDFLHEIGFQTYHSLILIGGILLISVLMSILIPEKEMD